MSINYYFHGPPPPPPPVYYEEVWAIIASKLPADHLVTRKIIQKELRKIRSIVMDEEKIQWKAIQIFDKIQERQVFLSIIVNLGNCY